MIRIAILLLVVGCGKSAKRGSASYYAEPAPVMVEEDYWGDDEITMDLDMAPAAEMERTRSDGGKKAKPKRDSPPDSPPPPPPPGEPAPEPAEQEPERPERMVHYDGWARLRATNPTETVDAIAELATEAGGRVDRLDAMNVTVRVPVDRFEAVYAQVLELGDVLDKSIRADDVTDQFLAIDLRVRTLRTTRDRLVALLAKAESEEEKLALLQQITRVTEELDATESRLRTLADLASMSRISVTVVPREAFGSSSQGPELAGFEWTRSLSPFNRGVFGDDKRIALPVPDGLVSLSKTGPYIAESADGTVMWTLRVRNDPVGDGDFWIAALEERIAEEFTEPARRELGRWSCLSLDEPGADEPYRWQVCLAPAGKHLEIAQAWFPGPEQVERYAGLVDGALSAGGGS